MKGSFQLSIISALAILSTACATAQESAPQKSEPIVVLQKKHADNIKTLFDETKSLGVIVIQNKDHVSIYGNKVERAKMQYVPASTFKMVNALIGLEHGKVTPTEIFKWDGQKKSLSAWEKDMTIGEGIKVSNVPVYQELARRVGLDLMRNDVKLINFGNNNIGSKVDDFWLVGPLKITPLQEANFAYRLATKTLPFKQSVQAEVQKMAFLEKKNSKKIYGKTGLGPDGDIKVGWLTGWVEQPNGDKTAFSLNMEMQPDTPYSIRQQVAYKALEQLGIL